MNFKAQGVPWILSIFNSSIDFGMSILVNLYYVNLILKADHYYQNWEDLLYVMVMNQIIIKSDRFDIYKF